MSRIVTYSSMSLFLCISVSLPYIIAIPLPLNESAYGKFLTFLLANKCKMPDIVEFPFSDGTEQPFDYLFTPLKECQTAEALKEGEEVYLLCKEIFEVFQNITCLGYSSPTKLNNTVFSDDVCTDIKNLADVFPKETEYISGKLADHLVCRILCANKYESLCKVLFWSYDVQAKLQSSSANNLEESGKVEQKNIKSNKDVPSGNNLISQKTKEESGLPDAEYAINEKEEINPGKNVVVKLDDTTKQPSNVDSTKMSLELLLNRTSVTGTSSSTLNKISKPVNNTQLDKKNVTIANKIPTKMSKTPETKDNLSPILEPSNEINVAGNLKVQDKEIKADVSSKRKQKVTEVENTHNEFILESVTNTNNLKDNPNIAMLTENLPQKQATQLQPQKQTTQLQNNTTSSDVKNELKKPVEASAESNDKFQEKGEGKTKVQTESDSSNIVEKGKLNEDVMQKEPNDLTNDNSKLLPEITTQNFDKTEDAEGQDEKEQELYNDTENDADYPKSDFENSFSPVSKGKDPDFKSVVNVVNDISANEISSNYDGFLISRNNMGRGSDDGIQVIPSFPEQEDSHFFFYFLSIVLILMTGYLIFHNKQKIIALIVEGRHERRRRSHGAGYKKLETK